MFESWLRYLLILKIFTKFVIRSASLFFGDIVGFTNITAMSTASQTIEFLNDLYRGFDAAIEHYDVYKVFRIL